MMSAPSPGNGFDHGPDSNFAEYLRFLARMAGFPNRVFKTGKSTKYIWRKLRHYVMRSQFEIESMIEGRLRSYLSRDKTGIRREVLRLLLRIKQMTIADILDELKEQFSVSFHTMASMVGIIASRIGILKVNRNTGGVSTYELKEKYAAMVVRLVSI